MGDKSPSCHIPTNIGDYFVRTGGFGLTQGRIFEMSSEASPSVKHCTRCSTTKPTVDFHKSASKRDGFSQYCKQCMLQLCARLYRRNGGKTVRDNHSRAVERDRVFVIDWLQNHACVDCGESDPVVLEFDHVRGEKHSSIANLVLHGVSIRKIAEEVAKCDVRCANCHRRVTAHRGGWWRSATGAIV